METFLSLSDQDANCSKFQTVFWNSLRSKVRPADPLALIARSTAIIGLTAFSTGHLTLCNAAVFLYCVYACTAFIFLHVKRVFNNCRIALKNTRGSFLPHAHLPELLLMVCLLVLPFLLHFTEYVLCIAVFLQLVNHRLLYSSAFALTTWLTAFNLCLIICSYLNLPLTFLAFCWFLDYATYRKGKSVTIKGLLLNATRLAAPLIIALTVYTSYGSIPFTIDHVRSVPVGAILVEVSCLDSFSGGATSLQALGKNAPYWRATFIFAFRVMEMSFAILSVCYPVHSILLLLLASGVLREFIYNTAKYFERLIGQ